jgi:hypothetical protein
VREREREREGKREEEREAERKGVSRGDTKAREGSERPIREAILGVGNGRLLRRRLLRHFDLLCP